MEFSIIITEVNEGIKDTVNSLVNQQLDFKKNIEIIIVTDRPTLEIQEHIDKFPKNFKIIQIDEDSKENANEIALKNVSGSYINFLEPGNTFTKDTLKSVLKFFNDFICVDVVSTPIYLPNEVNKNHWSNSRFDKNKVKSLITNPQYYQPFAQSSFIKASSARKIDFQDVPFGQTTLFINEILLNNPKIGLCKHGKCISPVILKKNPKLFDIQSKKEYYKKVPENYLKYLINKSLEKFSEIPSFIKYIIIYNFTVMLHAENTEDILDKSEVEEFQNTMRSVLENIEDEYILNNHLLSEQLKINALMLKYGELNETILSKIEMNTVFIDSYDIINDKLSILANIPTVFERDISVFVNGKEIDYHPMRFPQRDGTYLNYRYVKDYSFSFDIPLSANGTYELEFKTNNNSLAIDFSRPCNFSKTVGYAKTKKYLSILKDKKIVIEPKTTFQWIKQEVKATIKMLKEREMGYKVGIPFRLMYMAGYPFLKNKHIWFFMDHPENADDNGMHMFRYAQDKDKDIKKYFILDKNSKDLSKMKKIGDVLGYKSIKHRYLGLFVENIVTSHPDNGIIYPFWGSYPHLAGLLKSNTTFLQHGIIKDDISPWLNRFNMNLSILVTSSRKEYESLFENPYHYKKDVIKLLGLPRYDNLKNEENKKQIVIMPSWRRPLSNKTKEFISKSEYFNRFNSLINNEKLIEFARKHNYEIIFKPHPNVYNFIELYDTNDYVQIDYEKIDYQTIFNNGSLLITDYSSVAFDFSYLHKPILYYQYKDDYHFDVEGGYFKYETMGFGEVCRTEEELVDLICEYIENDCKIKDEYSKRVDDFFYYTDKNNCKRVYDAVKELPLKD